MVVRAGLHGSGGAGSLVPVRTMTSGSTITEKKRKPALRLDGPWNVLVFDDPVNLMGYVTMVFQKVLGCGRGRAEELMMTVHTAGRAVVWTGEREKAEFYVQQLHQYQMQASLEKTR